MNAEAKEAWVAALRSGDYKQGQGRLRSGDGECHCVYGVLCDISKLGRWQYNDRSGEYTYLRTLGCLPGKVQQWAGLGGGSFIKVMYDEELTGLVYLNDNVLLDFNELADIIEDQL